MGLVFFLQDQFGKVPLYWGITADGYVAFADNIDLLKGACGKSLASFPQGGCDRNYNTRCESSLSNVDQLPLIDCSCRSIISWVLLQQHKREHVQEGVGFYFILFFIIISTWQGSRILQDASSPLQLENWEALRILKTKSLQFRPRRKRSGVLRLR